MMKRENLPDDEIIAIFFSELLIMIINELNMAV